MKKSAKSYKTSAGAKRAVFTGKIMKTKGGKGKDTRTTLVVLML